MQLNQLTPVMLQSHLSHEEQLKLKFWTVRIPLCWG